MKKSILFSCTSSSKHGNFLLHNKLASTLHELFRGANFIESSNIVRQWAHYEKIPKNQIPWILK